MAITTMDGIVAAFTGGKTYRSDFNKNFLPANASATTGIWYDLSMGAGSPMMNSVIGSTANLAHQAISETTSTTATTAATSGNFATSVFTDTTHGTGRFTVGMQLTGAGVPAGVYITSLGTGTGANNGGTYNLSVTTGTISSVTVTGTAYPGGLLHGGDVSTDVKNMVNMSLFSAAATTAPVVFMLYDLLANYVISDATTTTALTFTGGAAWPRYADGKGVRAMLVPSVATGAGASTVLLEYERPTTGGTDTGRLTPSAPSLPILTASSPMGYIAYSGTGVGKYGPFIPLQANDPGIKSVTKITMSTSRTSGCLNLMIVKPLAFMPITTVGVASERDFLNQLPSMPRIYDGACLHLAAYVGIASLPANSSFIGSLDTVWG